MDKELMVVVLDKNEISARTSVLVVNGDQRVLNVYCPFGHYRFTSQNEEGEGASPTIGGRVFLESPKEYGCLQVPIIHKRPKITEMRSLSSDDYVRCVNEHAVAAAAYRREVSAVHDWKQKQLEIVETQTDEKLAALGESPELETLLKSALAAS